ncbi:MAG: hypothetical protein ACK5M0_03770 [Bacteroidales bacterium]
MNYFLKNTGYPVGVLIIGGLLIRFLGPVIGVELNVVLVAAICFWFGVMLHQGKRSKEWVHKFVIAFFFLFFLFWDMGYVVLPELKIFFNWIGLNGMITHLIYVYCGWSFFK